MTDTLRDRLAEIVEGDSKADVTFNTAIRWIYALLRGKCLTLGTTNTPPGSPADDDLHVVGSSPTGDWAGEAGSLALYNSDGWGVNGWNFIQPADGMRLWDVGVTPEKLKIYDADNTAWRDVFTSPA